MGAEARLDSVFAHVSVHFAFLIKDWTCPIVSTVLYSSYHTDAQRMPGPAWVSVLSGSTLFKPIFGYTESETGCPYMTS